MVLGLYRLIEGTGDCSRRLRFGVCGSGSRASCAESNWGGELSPSLHLFIPCDSNSFPILSSR